MSNIEIYSGKLMAWRGPGMQSLSETTAYFYSNGEHIKFSVPHQIIGTIISCDMFPNLVGTTRGFAVYKCKKIT